MERISMDVLTVDVKPGLSRDILIILDEFTRYADAITLRDSTARTVARHLFDRWILRYGIPQQLVSDRGANFMSELMTTLCRLLYIKKIATTAYRPQGNGSNERMHRTLYTILRSLRETTSVGWETQLSLALFVYHTTYHSSLQATPHEVLYGYKTPHIAFNRAHAPDAPEVHDDSNGDDKVAEENEESETGEEVQWIRKRTRIMQEMRDDVYHNMRRAQEKALQQANKKAHTPSFNIGDRVLVREHVRGKLDPFWKHTAIVVGQEGELSYRVQFDDPNCRRHPVIHASHLRLLPQ